MACQDNIAQVGVSVKLALYHSQVLSENSAVITFLQTNAIFVCCLDLGQ